MASYSCWYSRIDGQRVTSVHTRGWLRGQRALMWVMSFALLSSVVFNVVIFLIFLLLLMFFIYLCTVSLSAEKADLENNIYNLLLLCAPNCKPVTLFMAKVQWCTYMHTHNLPPPTPHSHKEKHTSTQAHMLYTSTHKPGLYQHNKKDQGKFKVWQKKLLSLLTFPSPFIDLNQDGTFSGCFPGHCGWNTTSLVPGRLRRCQAGRWIFYP